MGFGPLGPRVWNVGRSCIIRAAKEPRNDCSVFPITTAESEIVLDQRTPYTAVQPPRAPSTRARLPDDVSGGTTGCTGTPDRSPRSRASPTLHTAPYPPRVRPCQVPRLIFSMSSASFTSRPQFLSAPDRPIEIHRRVGPSGRAVSTVCMA